MTRKDVPKTIAQTIIEDRVSRDTIQSEGILPEHFVSENVIPEGTVVTGSDLKKMLERPHIVMQSAAFAGVTNSASENAHTKHFLKTTIRTAADDGVIYTPEADLNMRALAALYRHNGHHVTVLPPTPGLIDQHYSTDSNKNFQGVEPAGIDTKTGEGLWRFKKAVGLSPNFTHESRQPEADQKHSYLQTSQHNPEPKARRELIQMEHAMEFGDTRIAFLPVPGTDKKFVLAGLAHKEAQTIDGDEETLIGRSTIEGHKEFDGYLKQHVSDDIQVETIHLHQPFYHMDTTGLITPDGYFFTHPKAYTEESWQRLEELFGEKLVEINYDDVDKNFGGNATAFGDQIYISDKVSMETAELMASKGFDVNMTPIPWTIASGGGHRCMTSVDHIYVPGEFDLQIDENRKGAIRKVDIDYKEETLTLSEYDRSSENWEVKADLTHKVPEHSQLYRQEIERHGFSRYVLSQ